MKAAVNKRLFCRKRGSRFLFTCLFFILLFYSTFALDRERSITQFPSITLPVLILHGTEDKATKPSGSQHFYEQAGSSDKTLKLYEDHFHDLLNDVDKEIVMADIQSWIDERIPAENSAASGA
jgi:alpha-beta hydrolase superfamily lysophospholipase